MMKQKRNFYLIFVYFNIVCSGNRVDTLVFCVMNVIFRDINMVRKPRYSKRNLGIFLAKISIRNFVVVD